MKLKYILPDWDDIVDPLYDFEKEKHSSQYSQDRFKYGARLWELLGEDVIDGVLISLSTIMGKYQKILEAGGARKFLKLPSKMELVGDCGAWQYKDEELPPFKPEEVLEYYEALGVDYGVSLDHIPFFKDPQRRLEITFNNAVEMYRRWREKGYRYVLLGAVQGITVDDYEKFLSRLYKAGYRHFAVGGLAKRNTQFIDTLIARIKKFSKTHKIERIHFLGVTRFSLIPQMNKLLEYVEEVSFDSSTMLRTAWTRQLHNYFTVDGKAYTAIRVADADLLDKLRKYDRGELTYDEVAQELKKRLSATEQCHYLPQYLANLRDRPWKKCPCSICRTIGIDVVIFKGNDRNRRRGFHNVYVFSTILKQGRTIKFHGAETRKDESCQQTDTELRRRLKEAKKVLVVTNCTAEKEVELDKVLDILRNNKMKMPSFDIENEDKYLKILSEFRKPAGEIYGGTFKNVKKLAEKLRSAGKQVDIYIISARYGLISEDHPIIPYDATLKGLSKEEIRKWAEKHKIEQKLEKIIKDYDLIIIALPKEYAISIEQLIKSLLTKPNVIMILPRTIVKAASAKATLLYASSLKDRVKQIAALARLVDNGQAKTLDEWLRQETPSKSQPRLPNL